MADLLGRRVVGVSESVQGKGQVMARYRGLKQILFIDHTVPVSVVQPVRHRITVRVTQPADHAEKHARISSIRRVIQQKIKSIRLRCACDRAAGKKETDRLHVMIGRIIQGRDSPPVLPGRDNGINCVPRIGDSVTVGVHGIRKSTVVAYPSMNQNLRGYTRESAAEWIFRERCVNGLSGSAVLKVAG